MATEFYTSRLTGREYKIVRWLENDIAIGIEKETGEECRIPIENFTGIGHAARPAMIAPDSFEALAETEAA